MSAFVFNAEEVAPQTERTPWPKGRYKVHITSSEMKDEGTTKRIQWFAKCLESLSTNVPVPLTTLMWSMTVRHDNADAQRIGQSELSSLCHSVECLKITDTANLHGRPFIVEVDQEFVQNKDKHTRAPEVDGAGQPVGKYFNRIKGYYKADGSPLMTTRAAAPQAAATPPAWAQNAAPAPAPAPPPVAAPQAVVPPTPPPAAPAPVLYYINQNGVTAPSPVPLAQVLAMNPAEIAVNEYGKQEWVKGVDFFAQHGAAGAPAQAPAAAPSNTPPWMRPQQ